MPRQDVPYGGAICRLKERIAEIWDKLDQKLHSINGVEGDGAGNVEIVSGNDAVVIANDQVGHRIEVALDNSKLPAAAVSSVNGQTGTVRLDAADVPSDGNSNVQADITANKAAINDCFDSITSEQVARQNADVTLQTNINAALASIPEMSATPDPYKGVERDAQGRALAADPESGATDKTLVTANWVSQTGDGAPNNLIHKSGNETKKGKLNLEDTLTLYNENWETAPTTIYKWAFDSTIAPTKYVPINGGFVIKDVNNREIWKTRAYRDTNERDVLSIDGLAYDNTDGYLHFEIGPNGYRKITTDSEMQAADPAAGATDKTLVTANWVSQSGDDAPNNLIHRTGDETKSGQLKLVSKTIKSEQYAYIDYDYDDSSVVQHKGIRFYVNGVFAGEFLYKTNPLDNSANITLNVGNTLITPSVYGFIQFNINADGTKEIITNFPKPSNW